MRGQKHLIKCRCVLPQFMKMSDPPNHEFAVFSEVNDDETVVPKFAQCTNCGILHKVTEFCRSEIIVGKESMSSLVSIDDIKASLPENLISILQNNSADLPTWEMVKFIVENQQWGETVVLTSDSDGSLRQGKYVRIIGTNLAKVESFMREEVM